MGKTNLMLFPRPAHLGGEAVGDPEVRTMFAEELLDDILAAAGADDEAAVLVVMEHRGPPGLFSDTHAGLVRLQDAAAKQSGADQACLFSERRLAVAEDIDERALANIQTQQIGHQPRQALEGDRVAGAQIDRKGAQVWPERRAGFVPLRRLGLEPPR